MHPKEHRKIKNGTGHLTHLSLPNSELFIAESFAGHAEVDAVIADSGNACYLLYPDATSIDIGEVSIKKEAKQTVLFLLDATWAIARKMLRTSPNLQALPRVSFSSAKRSQFRIKMQPDSYCLSTMETVQTVLEILRQQGEEAMEIGALDRFLEPFHALNDYQIAKMAAQKPRCRLHKVPHQNIS